MNDPWREDARKRRAQGESIRTIARAIGVGNATVHRWLGVTVPPAIQARAFHPFHPIGCQRWNGTHGRRNAVENVRGMPAIAWVAAVPRCDGTRRNAGNASRHGVPHGFARSSAHPAAIRCRRSVLPAPTSWLPAPTSWLPAPTSWAPASPRAGRLVTRTASAGGLTGWRSALRRVMGPLWKLRANDPGVERRLGARGTSLAPLMTRQLSRRRGVLERVTSPRTAAPCFVMAESDAEADREIASIRAEFPDSNGPLFVMISSHRLQDGA